MAYATLAEFRLRVKPELLYTNKNTAISDSILQTCIDDASDEIDTHLRSQGKAPFVSWGGDVTRRCCDIASYRLMQWRGYNPELGADVLYERIYLNAIEWLDQVASGKLNPTSDDGTSSTREGFPSIVSGQSGNVIGGFSSFYSCTSTRGRGW